MTKQELKLWKKYKSEIDLYNKKGWEDCQKRNEELAKQHWEDVEKHRIESEERRKRMEEIFGPLISPSFYSCALPPYFIFVEKQASYEGFMDYCSKKLLTNK